MSKDIYDLKIIGDQLLCPEDKSPIFFVNLTGEIKEGNSKKSLTYKAEKVVVKGTLDEIKKSDQTKKQFLREFFKDASDTKGKVKNFDLTKVTIKNIEIIRSLGYGTKHD